jgi:chromosome segregation ATPase
MSYIIGINGVYGRMGRLASIHSMYDIAVSTAAYTKLKMILV